MNISNSDTSRILNDEQISLVQETFALVEPIADDAAILFYDRLFTLDPSLRPLFKEDLAGQKKALMATLKIAVKGLTNLATIESAVQQLGERHARLRRHARPLRHRRRSLAVDP